MIGVAEFKVVKGRGRRGKGDRKERQGSRKSVVLTDGSEVKWWGGVWRFRSTRWNTAVATSLQNYAMTKAVINGREVMDEERYTDFQKFMQRMVGVVGSYEFLRIVEWIKS